MAAFGAFVDIGVHQDGLVHISAMSKTFVKDPSAGANWEIAVDGMPRSYRVDRQIAINSTRYLHSAVPIGVCIPQDRCVPSTISARE